jgi:hypothetical protein
MEGFTIPHSPPVHARSMLEITVRSIRVLALSNPA